MDYLKRFRPAERPWDISNRLERMRYLVDHLVWRDSVFQLTTGEEWVISTSHDGHRLITLWPSEECAIRSMNLDDPLNFKFKALSSATIEDELLSKMYEDELIAAFPSPSQQYEMLTVTEFRRAMRFSYLLKRRHEDALTQEETRELSGFIQLRKIGSD